MKEVEKTEKKTNIAVSEEDALPEGAICTFNFGYVHDSCKGM